MSFSATGNLLLGSKQRPDMLTLATSEPTSTKIFSTNSRLNTFGCIPVVSTITGLGRALLGIVHTIVHLVCAIFPKNREYHLQETTLGAKNIVRGIVEAIPVIGNITLFIVDLKRINKFEKMAMKQIQKHKLTYNNYITLFIYGQEIAKRPIAEFDSEVEKLNRKLSQAELEKIIRNQG